MFIPLLLLSIIGCGEGSLEIADYYRVYPYVNIDNNGNRISAQNVLMCKLSSETDPFITDITNVQWNDSTIIAKTNKGYFIVEANSRGLCCGCGNKTIGPLTEGEIRKYIADNIFEADNQKIFE